MICIEDQEGPVDELLPYRNLWASVMAQALDDLTDYSPAIQHWARVWLDDTARTVGSFIWICRVLALDPAVVRDRIERGRVRRTNGRPKPPQNAHLSGRSRDMFDLEQWFKDWETRGSKRSERMAA